MTKQFEMQYMEKPIYLTLVVRSRLTIVLYKIISPNFADFNNDNKV